MSMNRLIREEMSRLIPVRRAKSKRGRKPIINGKELGGTKRRERTLDEEVHIGKKLNEAAFLEDKDKHLGGVPSIEGTQRMRRDCLSPR